MKRILVCDPIDEKAVARLRELGYDVVVKTGMDEDELVRTVPGFHCMIVRSATKVTARVIEAMDEMKIVLRGGVGIDNIDSAAAKAKGVKVRNTPGASSRAVAELTVGLMFALARHITKADASMQAGKWEKKKFKGTELAGKTLGLIGSGRIGGEVARMARALGMEVIAYDPYITAFEHGELVSSLDEVLAHADYVSLHVPLTDETRHMLSAEQFAKMKPTAYVVNCARGGVVDEAAFAKAVREGTVAGGAFDVYEQEPPADTPLAGLDSVIMTPHVGASTAEAQARIGGELVDIITEELPL